jgi:hypothetical protein
MVRGYDLEDIAYTVYWSVELDEYNKVVGIKHYQSMDMAMVEKNQWSIFVDFEPSEEFKNKAKEQIMKMDWSAYKPNTKDASAYSYLFRSDPNNPVSSNDQSR